MRPVVTTRRHPGPWEAVTSVSELAADVIRYLAAIHSLPVDVKDRTLVARGESEESARAWILVALTKAQEHLQEEKEKLDRWIVLARGGQEAKDLLRREMEEADQEWEELLQEINEDT